MILTEEQLRFLEHEFGVTAEDVAKMTGAEWRALRLKCFDIEVAEVMDAREIGEDITDRGALAADIVSIKFCKLHSDENDGTVCK